jgi:hypothetical protein
VVLDETTGEIISLMTNDKGSCGLDSVELGRILGDVVVSSESVKQKDYKLVLHFLFSYSYKSYKISKLIFQSCANKTSVRLQVNLI